VHAHSLGCKEYGLARRRTGAMNSIGWTRQVINGERVKLLEAFRRQAEKTLDRLDAAVILGDVARFPGHRFEKLKGARGDTYSIRINDQWRVCFKWPGGAAGPEDVTIEDYH
jgi:proteic killer suppression protein